MQIHQQQVIPIVHVLLIRYKSNTYPAAAATVKRAVQQANRIGTLSRALLTLQKCSYTRTAQLIGRNGARCGRKCVGEEIGIRK